MSRLLTKDELISQYRLIENTSKKYPNGSVWESASCGKFTIIGKTDRHNKKGSYIYCLCEFEDGAIVESDYTNISKGNVKSPNHPNVCGVGYMGQGKWRSKENGKNTKEYVTWLHMLRRCYSKKFHEKYPTYEGVTVCDRWQCFQNFCEDISKLYGYAQWKDNSGYELDKDIICEADGIFPKVYSMLTCMFVKKSENLSESTSRNNRLRAQKRKQHII